MVDDSRADRRLCRSLLEEALGPRLEFWEENVAYEGLKTCRAVAPDCVLLDYKLPDMTGVEFLDLLRQDEQSPPVVMLTGIANEQIALEAVRAGAQDYVIKDHLTADGLIWAIHTATQKVGMIRELKAERDQLARSLAEKEVLLTEVHHRVKNNLQVIASLLRLQADELEGTEAESALRDSQSRVESIALIHEQLYQMEDFRGVDLARHVRLLVSNVLRPYRDPERFRFSIAVDPIPLNVDRAVPLSLILNELISNALKHAFPDGRTGTVTICGKRRDGRVEVTVSDDGVGIRENVDPKRSKSLGLEIVNILSRQLKGSFELDRGDSAVTTFRVVFPEN